MHSSEAKSAPSRPRSCRAGYPPQYAQQPGYQPPPQYYQQPHPPPQQPYAAPAAAHQAQSPDFDSMPVHELKAYIQSHGGTLTGAVERADLVAIAKAMQ